MAGHRRTRNGDGAKATVRTTRPENRRTALAAKWGAAQSAAERCVVAARYVQGIRTRRQPDAALATWADRELEQLAVKQREIGDRLLDDQAREPLNPGRGHAA